MIDTGRPTEGASTKQLYHYAQALRDQDFSEFNYGDAENMVRYGTKNPPPLRIDQITGVKVALFVGHDDSIAPPLVGQWAQKQLQNSIVHYEELPNWDHD